MSRPILRYVAAAVFVALLQTGALGYQIWQHATILRHGENVLLKTLPVDPRDLLRGEYVILTYDISTVEAARVVGPRPEVTGTQRLWVRLGKQPDGFWTVQEASFEKLPLVDQTVVMQTQPFSYLADPKGEYSLYVKYGIERFYLPEGEGKALEQARNEAQVSVAVSVDGKGAAQIRRLLVDGKPVFEEPLY
ncbi:MAG: GDYXXLXY domain-containing protein [Allorhizobium sp.]